jgi:tRNA threonylcarbamoyladenosine biosynthesis protein TsaB
MLQSPNAFFLKNVIPTAAAVAQLAWQKYQAGLFEDVAYYEPFYVKEVHITQPKTKTL